MLTPLLKPKLKKETQVYPFWAHVRQRRPNGH